MISPGLQQRDVDALEEVEALGGQVVSVTEPIDVTTAIGQYMCAQALSLAHLQSQQIGEGWKRVLQYRVGPGPMSCRWTVVSADPSCISPYIHTSVTVPPPEFAPGGSRWLSGSSCVAQD